MTWLNRERYLHNEQRVFIERKRVCVRKACRARKGLGGEERRKAKVTPLVKTGLEATSVDASAMLHVCEGARNSTFHWAQLGCVCVVGGQK